MRPRTLEEFAGQRHLLGEGKVLQEIENEKEDIPPLEEGPVYYTHLGWA